jgi:hypothetical protein
MAELHIISILRSKRDELERTVSSYEMALGTARSDLAHINATLELFERDGSESIYPSRLSIVRMFKRGEIFSLCQAALAGASKGLDARELTQVVIHSKGMDEADSLLRRAIGYRIVQTMLRQKMRSGVSSIGKRRGVRVWRLTPLPTP